jgi:hypothetical protein
VIWFASSRTHSVCQHSGPPRKQARVRPRRGRMRLVLSEREMERGRGCRKQAKAGASALSRLRADLGASSTGARVADARRGADRNAELPFS